MTPPIEVLHSAIEPALLGLPKAMATDRARVLLLAIGLQESGLTARRQLPHGPARGLWQFERGTRATRGGVCGVYLHTTSAEPLRLFCRWLNVAFDPQTIWAELEHNDILAAGVARLMLATDARTLPGVAERDAAWDCYLRVWRPGKPRREHWTDNHTRAVQTVFEV